MSPKQPAKARPRAKRLKAPSEAVRASSAPLTGESPPLFTVPPITLPHPHATGAEQCGATYVDEVVTLHFHSPSELCTQLDMLARVYGALIPEVTSGVIMLGTRRQR